MNKAQILTELYNSLKLNEMLSKFNAGGGNEDLKSELFAVLCEKPEDKLIELHTNGQLMYFATGIVQRMIFQKGSRFQRMYRASVYEYTDSMLSEPDDTSALDKEKQIEAIEKGIGTLHWVEQTMLGLWQNQGDMISISRKTEIPYRQVQRIMKNAKTKLMSEVSGKIFGNYIVANMEIVLDCEDNVTPDNIIEILEGTLDYLKYMVESRQIPAQKCFIKELKPIRVKKII